MLITGSAFWTDQAQGWTVELDQPLPGQRLVGGPFGPQYPGNTKQQAIQACIEDLQRRGLTGRLRIN